MQHKLKVYLSGSYNEKEQILKLWTDLETEMPDMLELTYNWMEAPNSTETKIADLEIEGVTSCHVYIMYLTSVDHTRRGTCTEFGIAIGCGTPCLIYLSEDGSDMQNVFLQAQENAEVEPITCFTDLVNELHYIHESIQVWKDEEILDSKIYTQ